MTAVRIKENAVSLRRTFLLVIVAAVGLIVAGCGGTNGVAKVDAAHRHTLRLAFFADMATADPAVFYDIEGDVISQSVYDGLLRYKPGTTTLEGALASSWQVSSDGRTYTFHLRPATFSDGTRVTSSAIKMSFQRVSAVNQGPAYMLADVTGYATPASNMFVVHLKQPVSDFLDLMASVWGPKAINPRVLSAHASDHAQRYLKTHAAGTGAFRLTKFEPGTGYALARNPRYWGPKPYFNDVRIGIQPDVSSQLLQLQRGDLDALLHGVPLSSLDTLKGNKGVSIQKFDSLGTVTLALNQDRPALHSTAVRRAVVEALNVPNLVKSVWGDSATALSSAYPSPLLNGASSPLSYPYDVARIKAAIPKGLRLTVVYTPDSSGVQRRFADLMRQDLASVGVTVIERQVQLSTVYGYRDDTKSAADIYISTPTPDAAAPDAWARILWHTKGPLNFFNYSNPRVDAAIDAGLHQPDKAKAAPSYARAGTLATADFGEAPIAQVKDLIVVRSDLTGVEHVPAYPWALNLATLGRR